jgi:hypothetical protein
VPVRRWKAVIGHCGISINIFIDSSKMWHIWLCFVSCAVLSVAHYSDPSDIHTVRYTSDTFSTEVPKKNHFIMFFAPW